MTIEDKSDKCGYTVVVEECLVQSVRGNSIRMWVAGTVKIDGTKYIGERVVSMRLRRQEPKGEA
jgi:hypothetical protein